MCADSRSAAEPVEDGAFLRSGDGHRPPLQRRAGAARGSGNLVLRAEWAKTLGFSPCWSNCRPQDQ